MILELATGAYPYKDCKTDFEVLTKVLDSDPPALPENEGFSDDFRDFVKRCLTKDYRHRPKYLQLLEHPFLNYHESKRVDVPEWFHRTTREAGIILPTQEHPQPIGPTVSSSASMLNRWDQFDKQKSPSKNKNACWVEMIFNKIVNE